jgi:hypothetical protein
MLYSGIIKNNMKEELIEMLKQVSNFIWEMPGDPESVDLSDMMQQIDKMVEELEESDEDF